MKIPQEIKDAYSREIRARLVSMWDIDGKAFDEHIDIIHRNVEDALMKDAGWTKVSDLMKDLGVKDG